MGKKKDHNYHYGTGKIDFDFKMNPELEESMKKFSKNMSAAMVIKNQQRYGALFELRDFDSFIGAYGAHDFQSDRMGYINMEVVLDDKWLNEYSERILQKVWEVWQAPIGWRFATSCSPGQLSIWLTAEYLGEEEEAIVKETMEFPDKILEACDSLDELILELERMLTSFHDKCQAEKAMFE